MPDASSFPWVSLHFMMTNRLRPYISLVDHFPLYIINSDTYVCDYDLTRKPCRFDSGMSRRSPQGVGRPRPFCAQHSLSYEWQASKHHSHLKIQGKAHRITQCEGEPRITRNTLIDIYFRIHQTIIIRGEKGLIFPNVHIIYYDLLSLVHTQCICFFCALYEICPLTVQIVSLAEHVVSGITVIIYGTWTYGIMLRDIQPLVS